MTGAQLAVLLVDASDAEVRVSGPGGPYKVVSARPFINPEGVLVLWLEIVGTEEGPKGPWIELPPKPKPKPKRPRSKPKR